MQNTVSMKKNHEFRRLYAKGKSAPSPTLVVYIRRNGREISQLGITVGTKVGNAVIRNRVRRRLREIYRLGEHRLISGLDIVIVARVKSQSAEYSQLEKDFFSACKRLEVLKK